MTILILIRILILILRICILSSRTILLIVQVTQITVVIWRRSTLVRIATDLISGSTGSTRLTRLAALTRRATLTWMSLRAGKAGTARTTWTTSLTLLARITGLTGISALSSRARGAFRADGRIPTIISPRSRVAVVARLASKAWLTGRALEAGISVSAWLSAGEAFVAWISGRSSRTRRAFRTWWRWKENYLWRWEVRLAWRTGFASRAVVTVIAIDSVITGLTRRTGWARIILIAVATAILPCHTRFDAATVSNMQNLTPSGICHLTKFAHRFAQIVSQTGAFLKEDRHRE